MKEYYEQHFVHKFDTLDEMDQLLERCKLPKLAWAEIDNPNKLITIKVIESIINNLPNQKL